MKLGEQQILTLEHAAVQPELVGALHVDHSTFRKYLLVHGGVNVMFGKDRKVNPFGSKIVVQSGAIAPHHQLVLTLASISTSLW